MRRQNHEHLSKTGQIGCCAPKASTQHLFRMREGFQEECKAGIHRNQKWGEPYQAHKMRLLLVCLDEKVWGYVESEIIEERIMPKEESSYGKLLKTLKDYSEEHPHYKEQGIEGINKMFQVLHLFLEDIDAIEDQMSEGAQQVCQSFVFLVKTMIAEFTLNPVEQFENFGFVSAFYHTLKRHKIMIMEDPEEEQQVKRKSMH